MQRWSGPLFLLLAGLAHAAPELPQQLPQDCQVTGSQSHVDFGELNRPSRSKMLPRQISMVVSCRYSQHMLIRIDGENEKGDFSWEDGGHLRITLSNARLDNRSVSLRPDAVASGQHPLVLKAAPGMRFLPDGEQTSGRLLTFDVTVEPELDEFRLFSRERLLPSTTLVVAIE